MQVPAFSPDIVIITLLLLGGVYGLVAGKHKLRLFILSIYVGVVLAEQLGAILRPYATMLGPEQIAWILLGLPIVLFGLAPAHHGSKHGSKGSAIANILVGLGAGALILSSGLHLLPTSSLSAIDRDSFLAMQLQQYHLWLLGLLPVVALVLSLLKGKEKHH
jgi:hypothetical protein